ncbi:MAG: peptidoglycan DD-metalloendopeptidase family protein [Chloroflexi bacterium]|nr:peptidoglycan DD-metalloendopeptidase family protein [Chloroflexota bacterium]
MEDKTSPVSRFSFQNKDLWFSITAWVVALGMVAVVVYLSVTLPAEVDVDEPLIEFELVEPQEVEIPDFNSDYEVSAIKRFASLDTVVPVRARVEVEDYTVDFGESIFGIAESFNLTPETLLWANYIVLNDNPDFLEPGMELKIPPVDGVYYEWQEGDSLESVATELEATAQDIIDWVGNHLDLLNPLIQPGDLVMVPGGQREFRQWVVPTISRGSSGVSSSTYGPGACEGGYTGLYGTGTFVWPSPIHELIGNDFWSGHLGIDIASGEGVEVYASDSGVVVFSGWATGGYGYMIMIDHGNGYQTVYAHLNQVNTYCGQSVGQGQTIAYGGSSGNSTGPHLHFEIRYNGGFVNPWYYLPAP